MKIINYITAAIMVAVAVLCFAGDMLVPAFMSIAAAALTLIPTFTKRESDET